MSFPVLIHLYDEENIDLVIMDPPWPNKSTTSSRSDEYAAIDIYDIFKIDLPSILLRSPSALVAVWVTNKPKYRRFVVEKLFRDWGITVVADNWYWVKTDHTGRPVFDLNSKHRRCYEGLILGQWGEPASESKPPDQTVFLTTLLGHSRKPSILELLRPYLRKPESPRVLELFARCVTENPGNSHQNDVGQSSSEGSADSEEQKEACWISAGLEALKFNELGAWLTSENDTDASRESTNPVVK